MCKKMFFGMAAMPFPSNGILLIQGNSPRVLPMLTMNYASFPIPYFNLLFYFIGNGPALSFNILEGIFYANFILCCNQNKVI